MGATGRNSEESGLTKIALVSYGGTIVSVVKPGIGATPSLDVKEMVKQLLGGQEIAELTTLGSKQLASPHLTVGDLMDLAAAVREAIALGNEGIVITQGTDTIEEIAFGLDLLHDGDEPIVVTGALRNLSLPGADGPANLIAAIRVAASTAARGMGALVVLNDEVHAARFVRKSHTANPGSFRSLMVGPLGWVAEGDVRIVVRPSRRFHVPDPGDIAPPPVCLLKMSLGDDGRLLGFVRDTGYAGLVIEGFGGGHVSRDIAEPGVLESLMEVMPVVLVSRAGSGEVLRRTYGGFHGSETDLVERGVIFGGALDGPKARILLTLLLMNGSDNEEIRRVFAEVGPLAV
jgi:L-asparaginase